MRTGNNRLRKEIAYEAAKLLAVEGFDDYLQAKKKAAQLLGITNKKMMPSNNEIEFAIIEYQSLFLSDTQQINIKYLRQIALKAMTILSDYKPRLVGSVLSGTANKNSEIILHLFTDTTELVALFLEKKGIPFELCERRLTTDKTNTAYYTSYKFIADDTAIVLTVLPAIYIRKAAVDPVSGLPMRRANISEVEDLINL